MVFLIYAVFRSQTNLILDRFDPLLYFIPFINIISIICAFLFLISYIFQKNYIFILLIFLITLFSGNFYLNSKYIFLDPSYVYKNTMNELSNIIGEGKVAGDFSMGIRLYNNANVFVNPYRHYYKNQTRYYEIMNSLVEKKQVDYTVSYLNRPDYEDQWQRDRYYKLMDLGFELIGKYPIQEVYGEIGLYKLK